MSNRFDSWSMRAHAKPRAPVKPALQSGHLAVARLLKRDGANPKGKVTTMHGPHALKLLCVVGAATVCFGCGGAVSEESVELSEADLARTATPIVGTVTPNPATAADTIRVKFCGIQAGKFSYFKLNPTNFGSYCSDGTLHCEGIFMASEIPADGCLEATYTPWLQYGIPELTAPQTLTANLEGFTSNPAAKPRILATVSNVVVNPVSQCQVTTVSTGQYSIDRTVSGSGLLPSHDYWIWDMHGYQSCGGGWSGFAVTTDAGGNLLDTHPSFLRLNNVAVVDLSNNAVVMTCSYSG